MAPQERGRYHAMRAVRIALNRGVLSRQPCEICGTSGEEVLRNGQVRPFVHAHHDDYNFPLSVRWLCKSHHHSWHVFNLAVPMRDELLGHSPKMLFRIGYDQLVNGFGQVAGFMPIKEKKSDSFQQLSRRRVWQLRQTQLGNCIRCANKAVTKHFCQECRAKHNEANRRRLKAWRKSKKSES